MNRCSEIANAKNECTIIVSTSQSFLTQEIEKFFFKTDV